MRDLLRSSAAAILLLAAGASIAAAQEVDTGLIRLGPAPGGDAPEPAAAPEVGAARRGFDHEAFESRLESLWFRRKTFLASGRTADAAAQLEQIRSFCAEEGVRRLEAVSGALVAEAKREIDEDRLERALESLHYAELFDPGRAQIHRARAEVHWRRQNFVGVAHEALAAVSAAARTSFERLEVPHRLAFLFVLALTGTSIVFSLLVLVRYQVPFRHEVEEWVYARSGDRWSTIAGWAALGLPLLLWVGAGWAAFYWILVTFRFMGRAERVVAVSLLVLTAAAAPVYRAAVALYGSSADPAVRTMLASTSGEYDPDRVVRLRVLVESHPTDPLYHFLLGGLYKNGRYLEEAFEAYKTALTLDPGLVAAEINLGNIYASTGQHEQAIVHYRRGIEADPESFLGWFNLHLAQSEAFRFREAEQSLERARQIDARRLDELMGAARELGGRPSAHDATLDRTSVWEAAVGDHESDTPTPRVRLAGALDPLGITALVVLAGCGAALFLSREHDPARRCIRCGRPFCHHCKSSREAREYCSQCLHLYVLGDGLAPGSKSRKQYQVDRYQRRARVARRVASFLVPGTHQLLFGRPVLGLLLVTLWLAAILAVWPEVLVPFERWTGADLQTDLVESAPVPALFEVPPLTLFAVLLLPLVWLAGNVRRRARES